MRRTLIALALAGAALTPASSASAQSNERVYLSSEEAFVEIFGDGVRVELDRGRLSPAEVRAIAEASGSNAVSAPTETYRVYEGETLVGYAMILEERGKYRPITFMVGTTPDLEVLGVEVMVYREDRGDEVRRDRFLRQYEGKRGEDPIRTYRDIVNITGATISVMSLNIGVRRALATLARVYDSDPAPATTARRY